MVYALVAFAVVGVGSWGVCERWRVLALGGVGCSQAREIDTIDRSMMVVRGMLTVVRCDTSVREYVDPRPEKWRPSKLIYL